MQFDVVIGHELVKVHNPSELFDACHEAGIGIVEATFGMIWRDDGPYLRTEVTRRVPKARRIVSKGIPLDTPEARLARIERYASMVASGVEQLFPDPAE